MSDRLRQTLNCLRAFFHKEPLDDELDAEMASHLAFAIEENLERGLSPQEARRQALIGFGGVEQARGTRERWVLSRPGRHSSCWP